jgi:hypothetical protein
MEVGEYESKVQLLKLYPDAHCKKVPGYWMIVADQKMISHSFESEEKAWEWSLAIVNNRILEKLRS